MTAPTPVQAIVLSVGYLPTFGTIPKVYGNVVSVTGLALDLTVNHTSKMREAMKKFDLARVLKGDIVVCRNGMVVEQLTWFDCGKYKTVAGVVDDQVFMWYADGRYLTNEESCFDLFMGVTKHIRYVPYFGTHPGFDSEEELEKRYPGAQVIKVEYEL